ncbi:hypothetical protein M569_06427, partial [Genlisea aurea]
EEDVAVSKSENPTLSEDINRRICRINQFSRIYREHYWALMEELKLKHREYYWEYGRSPYVDEEEHEMHRANGIVAAAENSGSGNFVAVRGVANGAAAVSTRCSVHGCKAKAMALTRFCHMHILSDTKQKLYKPCSFSIKSSTTGPILCGKPILKSTVPSYCPLHFQKAEKHMVRALKKAGLNVSSTYKLAPKFHTVIAEYIRQIQLKRRAAQRAN